ncbi:MAG: hypothetical protein WA990_04490 [Rubrobacteraceae bacterium]
MAAVFHRPGNPGATECAIAGGAFYYLHRGTNSSRKNSRGQRPRDPGLYAVW